MIEDISASSADIKATMAGRPNGVTAKHLSKLWKIDVETAKRSIEVTTQLRQHEADASLSCNYSTDDRMLRYKESILTSSLMIHSLLLRKPSLNGETTVCNCLSLIRDLFMWYQ
jgi:hypothetical protein